MKKYILFIVALLVFLTACQSETVPAVSADLPINDPPVEEQQIDKPSDVPKENSNSTVPPIEVGLEETIQKTLNDNLNAMLDVTEPISCYINADVKYREILVNLYCYDNSINDDWSDVNSSMFLLEMVLQQLSENLDSLMEYGSDIVNASFENCIMIRFDYYDEERINAQKLTVALLVEDGSLYLDPDQGISLTEFTGNYINGAPSFIYDPNKNPEIYKCEYFPFEKSGVWYDDAGAITDDAYKYVSKN
ncbi:MAG: membrane lipoprotein lipid attachment site-containing protein [Oscillospiraceae bacterium]